jgi:fumarate hydratase subunit alpha
LKRGKAKYGPAVIHIDIVKGNKLKLTVLPKGFGSENKTKLIMLNPTDGLDKIKDSVVNAVKQAGPDACPPFVIGVGIGGTADYASFLAKQALLKKLTPYKAGVNGDIAKLEHYLLKEINKLNIGPMGMGSKFTCLGVNILTYPTHIAGLPLAINISCHALRSAQKVI